MEGNPESQTCNGTTQEESRVCVRRKGGGEVSVQEDAQNDVGSEKAWLRRGVREGGPGGRLGEKVPGAGKRERNQRRRVEPAHLGKFP